MADLFSMKNRVVLLTGASRGLGRDMAITLGAAGATVLCAGRNLAEVCNAVPVFAPPADTGADA